MKQESSNKLLHATRETRAREQWRWASFMRFPALPFILCLALPAPTSADSVSEFEAARERWRTADVKSYSFIYEWAGGVVVAPKCAGAKIRVVVRNGVSAPPIVARGSARCPRGTHGAKAIGFAIPDSIDSAFAEMSRYIYDPPTPARIVAKYDPTLGVPLTYYAEKLAISDNDEGFRLSSFKVLN